jgi:hypothetical protein
MRTPVICLSLVITLLSPFASAQWVQIGLSDRGISKIAVGSSGLFAITSPSWYPRPDSGSLFRSTDGGVSWVQNVQSGARDIAVTPDGSVFMVKEVSEWETDENLYRSSDGGITWSSRSMTEFFPATGGGIYRFRMNVAVGPTGTVLCGAECSNQWLTYTSFVTSTDDGFSWTVPWTSSWYGADSLGGGSFAFSGHHVITLGYLHGVTSGEHPGALLLSSDYGLTWRFKGQAPHYARPVALNRNGYVLCGTPGLPHYEGTLFTGGLYLCTDSVASWTFDPNNSTFESSWTRLSTAVPEALLPMPEGGTLAGAESSGVFFVNDNGDSIKSLNEGLADLHVHTLALDNAGYAYAGTNNGVWRRPISQIVSVSEPPEVPTVIRLEQNYPNPFNPSTTIAYSIPRSRESGVESKEIKLVVYDILGRKVAVLVNEKKVPGKYEVEFDATRLSSGMYFYRLHVDDPLHRSGQSITQTKRMMLLK